MPVVQIFLFPANTDVTQYVILLLSCYVLQCESVKRVRIISSKQLFNEKLSILITFLEDIVLKLRGEATSQSRKGFNV